MSLRQNEIKLIKRGEFVLDALEMVLVRSGVESDQYRGPGFVRQNPEGGLEFTIYDTQRTSDLSDLDLQRLPAGSWISENQFYELTVRDWEGRNWRARRIRPRTSGVYGETGLICHGQIDEIALQSDEPSRRHRVTMFIPGAFETPWNAGTRTIQEVSGVLRSASFDPNVWDIEHQGERIRITRESDGLMLSQSADQPFPSEYATRLEEALWLVLARPSNWQILTWETPKESVVTLRTLKRTRRDIRPRIGPPLDFETDQAANNLGRLFSSYLDYIVGYSQPRFHPISVVLLQLLRASAQTLEAEALALGTGLESLVRREFAVLGKPEQGVRSAFDSAAAFFKDWTGPSEVKKRVISGINGYKGTNAFDAMKQLAANGVLTQEQINAWRAIRNQTAHGKEIDKTIPEIVRHCDLVYMGFLRALFQAIHYSGWYTDRTQLGWPHVEFTPITDLTRKPPGEAGNGDEPLRSDS
jgi:hypothetical protein